ncbi:heavy metal translocatin [Choiromyces venosus 120613-1]|uniref:Heavy metal translocatin n=1 Tax=Choiromyces venosus 120613-1 TaxID=1336337 RepID=A0A3N4JKM9_9PEZI|nr:heavy metal translocatin [Choiromyces venosus 120613-1]
MESTVSVNIARALSPGTLAECVDSSGVALYEAVFSIGGMTCASCSNRITEVVESLKWVQSVRVDLLSNSATVLFDGMGCGGPEVGADAILQQIEDTGFDCSLEDLDVAGSRKRKSERGIVGAERTVSLKVDGMTCTGCADKVAEVMGFSFPDYELRIESPPITLTSPVIHVRYKPQPPEFTVRHIASVISSISPDFVVSVYHPPTIEDRSRQLQQTEQWRLLLRLIFCLAIAIPTFLIGIVWMTFVAESDPVRKSLSKAMWSGRSTRMEWALFFLATPVMFFIADVFHKRAIRDIRALWRKGSPTPVLRRFYRFGSMNLLISLGVSISYFASLVLLAINAASKPAAQPIYGLQKRRTNTYTYFDSTVFLTMFLLIGRFLEAYSKRKTAEAVNVLGKLRPAEALLVDNRLWRIKAVPTDQLEVGDIVSVVRNSSPPADGTIISGVSQFDESPLTGETKIVPKIEGDMLLSGTMNQGQAVNMRVESIGSDTMLSQIVNVLREGQTRRAPIERLADVITEMYLDIQYGGWSAWSLSFAIAVFVIACPCGIGLAAPTALYVGAGLAAKFGILAKGGGEAFQEAAWLDCIVFSKTGTLTQGNDPKVTDELMLVGAGEDRRMAYAVAQQLEEGSSHPLSRAIVAHCEKKDKIPITMWDIEDAPGRGLSGVFKIANNKTDVFEAVLGSERFMEENGVLDMAYHDQVLSSWKSCGKSVVLLAIRKQAISEKVYDTRFRLVALYAAADIIRPEAPEVVRKLQESGIGVWMISGDNTTTAISVASMVGIPREHVISGVHPAEKPSSASIRASPTAAKSRATIALVGDGINDAPALSISSVGISMNSATDVNITSAKFILVSSNLNSLITLTQLASFVFRRVKVNFMWACVYNVLAVPIAAGALYAGAGIKVGPVWAAGIMAFSSLSVVCSSLLMKTEWWGVGFRRK